MTTIFDTAAALLPGSPISYLRVTGEMDDNRVVIAHRVGEKLRVSIIDTEAGKLIAAPRSMPMPAHSWGVSNAVHAARDEFLTETAAA